MRFEFATATRIIFGTGTLKTVGTIAAEMLADAKALIVIGAPNSLAEPLLVSLSEQGIETVTFGVTGEPTIESVDQCAKLARQEGCNLLVALGGGSAVDTGKAASALMTNPGEPLDYLEVIGQGKPLTSPPVPYIAIPTTAGTGAEVTRNAVLTSTQHRVKVSLRSPLLLPRVALVDPELTYTLPAHVTAATGLDALTQLIEAYVSIRANPMTDGLCREGLTRAGRSLRRAYEHGDCSEAREDMALASLLSGLTLANAGLGAVHGFAGPLGGMFAAPHGALCAALLPHVMTVNLQAMNDRLPDGQGLKRFDDVARILTDNPNASAPDGVAWIHQLSHDLEVPPLAACGITNDDIPTLTEKAANASSMRGNPITLTPEELNKILTAAM